MLKRFHTKAMALEASSFSLGKSVAICAATIVLSACSGSGESGGISDSSGSSVSGRAVKGIIGDARIEVFQVNPLGEQVSTEPSETTTTEMDGTFNLSAVTEPSLVRSVGGSFVDEADQDPEGDGRNQITLGPNDTFESVLFPGETTVAITPYTQLLVDKARREVTGDNFQQVIEKNRQIAINAFGFDPFNTMPADPVAPGDASLPARQYALLLGGVANAINRISIGLGFESPRFEIIQAVISDLSDGVLDGLENGSPVSFVVDNEPYTLPTDVALNGEIGRFANNNFDAYAGLRTSVNEQTLSSSGANEAPVSTGAAGFTIVESGNRTLSVADFAVTDPDAGPNALTFSVIELPLRADIDLSGAELDPGDTFTLADLQNGNLNYSDFSSGNGTDSFIVSANDGVDDLTITVNVTITAAAQNQAPVISGTLSFELDNLTSFEITDTELSATDPDDGPEPLLFSLDSLPLNGTLSRSGVLLSLGAAFTTDDLQEGLISYNANADQGSGVDSFSVSASDGEDSDSATLSITITSGSTGNTPPVAEDDSIQVAEGGFVSVLVGGETSVLANDTDDDGDSLTAILVNDADNGVLQFSSDGSFTYQHDGSETAGDSFSYLATDGLEDSNTVTVAIFVSPVNDQPEVSGGFNVEIGHSKVLTATDFGVSDPDSDPDDRIYSVDGNAPNGTLRLNGVGLNSGDQFIEEDITAGNVSYKHDGTPGDTGVQILVDDGSGTETAVGGGGLPIIIDPLDVDGKSYHSMFSYPEIGISFDSESGDFGQLEFSIEQFDVSTSETMNGPELLFDGTGTEVDLEIGTRNEQNYFASFEDESFSDAGENNPIAVTVHGEFQLLLPTEREFEQNGFDELIEARSVRFIPADLETGISVASLQHTFDEFGTAELNGDGGMEELDVTRPTFRFLEQDLFVLVEKATSASNATLNGRYGAIELGFRVDDGPTGRTNLVNIISEVSFDGVGTLTGGEEFISILERDPAATPLLARSSETSPGSDTEPYNVSADGSIAFDGGADSGFVSADGSFFATPFADLDQGSPNEVISAEISVILGVRKDPLPELDETDAFRVQGYQVCHLEDGSTELERFVRNTLTFSTSGAVLQGLRSLAIRDSDSGGVAFLPIFLNESVPLSFSTSTGGELTFEGTANDRDYQLNGYLADTGRMMVFNIENDYVGTTAPNRFCRGILIAVRDTGFDLDNTPPVAVIENLPTLPIAAGESVTLNAVEGNDADGDTLSFNWFVTAGSLNTTTGSQVVYTAPAAGSSAARIYLTASDGDFQNTTFGTIVYNDPDPMVFRNEAVTVEQGHVAAIDNQALQTNDFDTAPENLIYMIDSVPTNGRVLLNGAAIISGVTFTQADIDNGNLSYEQSGRSLTSDSFDFTVTDGNADDSGTFSINVVPFDANMTLQGFGFLLGFESIIQQTTTFVEGILENNSQAVFERSVSASTGGQLVIENRFTSEETDAELSAFEDFETGSGIEYSLTVDQESNPNDIFVSSATLLPSGLIRQSFDRVVLSPDIGDNSGDVLFPGTGNFIPLDLSIGLYLIGFAEFEETYRLMDSTGDGQPDSLDPSQPVELDGGFFFDIDAEKPTGTNLATLDGNYRSVGFEFAFESQTSGEVNISTGLTDLVFDGAGSVSGGFDGRELNRDPNGSPEVTRTSGSDPNGFDGSSYTVSNEGLITFTDPNPFTFEGLVTGDGSFFAHRLAQVEGSLTLPSSVDQFVEYGVRVSSSEPNLANRRFLGELQLFCYDVEGGSRVERLQQAVLEFNADGTELVFESLRRVLSRFSDTSGVDVDTESRGTETLSVTAAPNGGFSASVNINGDNLVIDGALSENGRVMVLRYGLDGSQGSSDHCEGFGLAGADFGQEIINDRPELTVESDSSTVQKGQSATLTATVTDPNGDAVTVNWVATTGFLNTNTGTQVIWTAPSAPNAPGGTARIYATASDGDMPITESVDIEYID